MNSLKAEFKIIRNTKAKKYYSIKISPIDNFVTIYVFNDDNKNCIKVLRINKKWLLKELIESL